MRNAPHRVHRPCSSRAAGIRGIALVLLAACTACCSPQFNASPLRLLSGQPTTLTWSASGPCTLTSDPDVTGLLELPSSGTRELKPSQSCQLTLHYAGSKELKQDIRVHQPAEPFPLIFTFFPDPKGGVSAKLDLPAEEWGMQGVETLAFKASEPGARPITFTHDGKEFRVEQAAGYQRPAGERLKVAGHWEARGALLPTEHAGPPGEQVVRLHFNLCLTTEPPR